MSALVAGSFVIATTSYAATIESLLSPGPLSQAHVEFESECGSCHDPLGEKTQLELCSTCHEEVKSDIDTASGFHGKHPQVATAECQSCHREHKGAHAATLEFPMERFDHDTTDFALLGAHDRLECTACHADGQPTRAAPGACVDCHGSDDPHEGALGTDCGSCHLSTTWQKSTFDHAQADFQLLGTHAWTACEDCHADQLFKNTPSLCSDCHGQDDVHRGEFGSDCGSCHNESAWQQTSFDHGSTGFFLRGAHAALSCAACHGQTETGLKPSATGAAQVAGTQCADCHSDDDPHEGRRGDDCGGCHNEKTWEATFDHEAVTGFPLVGAHDLLTCQSCHVDGTDAPLPTTCHECHTPDPHEAQLGQDCASCHNQLSFTERLRFDHHLSAFPLLGKHAGLDCEDCHLSLRFGDVSTACQSCHTEDDPHSGRMGEACASCHNPTDWLVTRFDHGATAQFPLTGVHAELACDDCHRQPAMLAASTESDCYQCHRQDDPHDGGFGRACEQCHTTLSFQRVKGFSP